MKKYSETIWFYIISFSLVVFVLTATTGQVQAPQPKMLTVTLSEQDWGTIMYVIRQSNAPYPVVTKVQDEFLLPQLQKQLSDTTKKVK